MRTMCGAPQITAQRDSNSGAIRCQNEAKKRRTGHKK